MSAHVEIFLTTLVRSSVAAGVLVLLVLATQQVFRRQLTPHWRCALWFLVLARLFPISFNSDVSLFNFLPPWAGGTPATQVSQPTALTPTTPWLVATPTSANTAGVPAPDSEPTAASATDTEESSSSLFANWTWTTTLFSIWLTGVIALASYVVVTSRALTRSLARATPLSDRAMMDVLRDCCDQMGISRAPLVLESETVRTPALHGLARPRLLLPVEFSRTYSADEQRFVFLHELAHLRRRDLPLNWLMTGVQIVHWFNPLVWFGFARWRIDREIACDAAALEAAGSDSNHAYGRTMLRLLENVSLVRPPPGLVGILEDRRQLHRRMKMIAGFAPSRRPLVAVGLLVVLGLIGLTDPKVSPMLTAVAATASATPLDARAIPQPIAPYVLFLVNGSATMLRELDASPPATGETRDTTERGQTFAIDAASGTDDQKRSAPKWVRAGQTLEQMLNALPAKSSFRVALFFDDTVEIIGGRSETTDRQAIPDTLTRLRRAVPHGAANLESAFAFSSDTTNAPPPERIVLITDGLPTTSQTAPTVGEISESQRIRSFEVATKRLAPRIPVHTVLIPSAKGDPGAAGLFWELANATRGQLTTSGNPGIAPRTHLAFVIDTSGSMRDPNNGGLWPIVINTIEASLDLHPQLAGLQLIDGDGRFILGRQGTGASGWLADTPETRESMRRVLRRYNQDTVSNPVPGIYNAIRFLRDKNASDMRMGIYVLGDEFNSRDPAGTVLDRINTLNPRDANGRRPITINAIGFPTTIRYQFSMGNTGLRFANLMRLLTHEHDGSFVALPDL
jgi:beta-lactamase regulating signal transducer with metallopeptidase domain